MTDINITDEQFYDLIRNECAQIAEVLIGKNRQYGNSILRSPNVFSHTTPLDKIADRLDDKLSRVISGREDDPEDAKLDIAGYLILERAVRRAMNNGGCANGCSAGSQQACTSCPREVLQKPDTSVPVTIINNVVMENPEESEPVKQKKAPAKRKSATKKTAQKEESTATADSIAADLAGIPVVDDTPELSKTTEDDLLSIPAEDLLGDVEASVTEEPQAAEKAPAADDGLMGLL